MSEGSQYNQKQCWKIFSPQKKTFYKKYWANISNLKINKTAFSNDGGVRLTEEN
jgi:hypothetical protein